MFSDRTQEEPVLMGFAKLECSNVDLRPEEKIESLDLKKIPILFSNTDA